MSLNTEYIDEKNDGFHLHINPAATLSGQGKGVQSATHAALSFVVLKLSLVGGHVTIGSQRLAAFSLT